VNPHIGDEPRLIGEGVVVSWSSNSVRLSGGMAALGQFHYHTEGQLGQFARNAHKIAQLIREKGTLLTLWQLSTIVPLARSDF
jgi:hypothetical protein